VRVDLTGKTALVTGASRGIGRAIAKALAGAGATVCLNFKTNRDQAKDALTAIESRGGRGFIYQADVSDGAQVEAMVEAVLARSEGLDILVNNAGLTRDRLLLEMDNSDWEAVLQTNLAGVYHCCKAAARGMIMRRWGRIINLSSVTASRGAKGQVNYAASKGAVEALTRSLAIELAPRGVTVNAIAPGLIQTDMSRPILAMAEGVIRERIPMRRAGTAEDIAPLAVFLASEAAGYLTGQVIAVDGGLV
jgi:3-oxoacyl-[acyl-carrier protein] reductase